jgi:hypothetical protein
MLRATDEAILRAAWEYWYLTARDVQRLLDVKSLPHVRGVLRRLCGGRDFAEGQYLLRCPIPQTRKGGIEKFYTLGIQGRDFVASEMGLPVEGYYQPAKTAQRSYGTLMHDLSLTRFLIALRTWCHRQEHLSLSEIRTQYELAHDPLLAEVSHTSPEKDPRPKVVPDAWVHIAMVTEGRPLKPWPLLIEIDRGTQYAKAFKERLLARLDFIRPNGLYSQMFATEFVTIVYLTTAGDVRRDTMCRWARQVLAAEQREDWAEVLLFGEVSFAEMYEQANRLFTEAVWRRPDGGAAVRLFGEPPDTGGQQDGD